MSPIEPAKTTLPARYVPWGPVSAVMVTLTVYFSSQFLGVIAIGIYPLIQGWNNQRSTDWLTNNPFAQFGFVVIVETLTLGMIWLFLRHRRAKASQIGLKRPRLRDIAYALSGFAAYFLIYIGVITIAQQLLPQINNNQKQELGFSTNTTGLALYAIFVSLVLLPPIVEEIVARGFLYTGLRRKLPKVLAAIITSILFGAAHLQAGSGKSLLWVAALDTFILSMVLVYLRERTDSLWASILLHMMKNGIAFVSLFVLHLS